MGWVAGVNSEFGWGVAQDWKEAERWYDIAVTRKDPLAKAQLIDLRLRLMRNPVNPVDLKGKCHGRCVAPMDW